jgi:prepilin-type N-terminal cleavage/methylation domain-containing protein
MRLSLITKKNRGFTLVEVMVTIAIIGILAAIAIPNYLKFRQKGLIGAASGDLKKLQRKIQDLGHDTGRWPDRNPAGVAVGSGTFGNEIWDLSNPAAGLTANGGSFFQDWQGPYLSGPFQDPWGHNFFFDSDYDLDGRTVAVVGSFGPNGCCPNTYDDDDIVLIIPAN